MIEIKNLHKVFNKKLHVLNGIDYKIEDGEKVVIIGPSGSGKSTFLRCLNLLETPTDGQIFVDGVDITAKKTNIDKVRMGMGMVFQHFNLFPHFTVAKNIWFSPVHHKLMTKEEGKKEAMRLLERVGLADKADAYPSTLSGGQKQRIAIVRALAMKPKVMLLTNRPQPLTPKWSVRFLTL